MSETTNHTTRIYDKLQQLLKRYASLQKENEKLKNELAESKNRDHQKEEALKLLNLRIEVLKASKGTMTEEEKKSFEKVISTYLREIDNCISLLND